MLLGPLADVWLICALHSSSPNHVSNGRCMPDEYVGSGVEEGRTHRRVRELIKTTTANSRETTFRDLDFTNSGFPTEIRTFSSRDSTIAPIARECRAVN